MQRKKSKKKIILNSKIIYQILARYKKNMISKLIDID